jgi:hypothetical protein
MNDNDTSRMPPSLSPAIEALLAHERAPVAQPEVVRARALARARAAMREDAELDSTRWRASLPGKRWLALAAAASVVLGVGLAAAFQMMRKSPEKLAPAHDVHSLQRSGPIAPTPVLPEPRAEQEPTPTGSDPASGLAPAKVVPTLRRAATGNKGDDLREEVRLLDRARQLDARRDYPAMLAVVTEHERSFPTGRLTEEREVVRVKALVGLGRGGEARQAAVRFHRQFPRSVLSHSIDETIATIP